MNRTRNKLQSYLRIFGFLLYSAFGLSIFFLPKNESFRVFQSGISLFQTAPKEIPLKAFPIQLPTIRYGFVIDTFQVKEGTIKNGEFLADILLRNNMSYPAIDSLVKQSEGVFDTRTIRSGKPYTFLYTDTTQRPEYFIYEPNVYEYTVFKLKDDMKVYQEERPVTKTIEIAEGTIESSLWNTMIDQGLDFDLAVKMENAMQWSVSFYYLQKGDHFKLVYEQNHIDGEPVGIGDLKAAYFKNEAKEHFAIYFDGTEERGYYGLTGKPMKKAFLKAPVKYARISSRYNLRRFHPILRRRRPHLGTDYAAPYGTPIYAVGNGTVTHASYTKGNGRYVKIRHNETYQTQYLHMSRFAKGIHPGTQVDQGQVIGYVGSSGLATGPHVCFRFWKHGRQVNHLNLEFPTSKPLPVEDLPAFEKVRDHYLDLMGFQKDLIAAQVIEHSTTDQEPDVDGAP